MLEVFEAVSDFARQGQPVILFGPSGAGKEFLARYYFAQYRKMTACSGGFYSLNCSQLVRETAQSTLFGHVKGAFTDAYKDKKGLFELARQGVLFLDEIGDLDQGLQTMVNRAMDENTREASKLGSEKSYSTEEVKVICATERPRERINDSLLYRAGLQIHVPGLDERDEDVEEAIIHFSRNALEKRLDLHTLLSSLLGLTPNQVTEKTLDDTRIQQLIRDIARHLSPIVKARDWPGNFRALRTAVDSGVIRAKKVSSSEDFLEDVKSYFLYHLGDYSTSVLDDMVQVQKESTEGLQVFSGEWMELLKHQVPDLDNEEMNRLSFFLSEYTGIPFKRKDFEKFMTLNTRNAQLRISLLIENGILEKVEGKGYKYRVKDKAQTSGQQGFSTPQFMDLPAPAEEGFLPEKLQEALDVIKNSRGIFVSDPDPEKRANFLGALGGRLWEDFDVIYYSFYEKGFDDFIRRCREHLKNLDMEGWFNSGDYEGLELREQIIGLSGYFTQSLSQHRKTILLLEGIDVFSTGEMQELVEQMIYFWHPIQFVLSSNKQFFHQQFSASIDFMELKL